MSILHRFFDAKVANVRACTAGAPALQFSAPVSCELCVFSPVTPYDLAAIVRALPVKQCYSDPLPMRLLKANIDLLAPFLSHLFCWSLQHSVVLSLMKSAYIMPIIKKADMDSMCPKSYPISHLSVRSKLLECLVSEQFVKYLTDSRLLPGWQSAYRRFHSTETAVLGVYSDILTALDSGNLAMLSSLGSRRI